MIELNLSKKPKWVDLIGEVRVKIVPVTTSMMVAMRADEAVTAGVEAGDEAEVAIVGAKAIARQAIVEWDGVGDEEGNSINPTPEAIDALLDIWPVFEAFQEKCVLGAIALDQEKNASAPLLTGSTAGEATIAADAKAPAKTAQA